MVLKYKIHYLLPKYLGLSLLKFSLFFFFFVYNSKTNSLENVYQKKK